MCSKISKTFSLQLVQKYKKDAAKRPRYFGNILEASRQIYDDFVLPSLLGNAMTPECGSDQRQDIS